MIAVYLVMGSVKLRQEYRTVKHFVLLALFVSTTDKLQVLHVMWITRYDFFQRSIVLKNVVLTWTDNAVHLFLPILN